MAISGAFQWPPTGSFPWPPSSSPGMQEQFASREQRNLVLPSRASNAAARTGYTVGFLGGRCARAAKAGLAAEMTLAQALADITSPAHRFTSPALAQALNYAPRATIGSQYIFQFTDWNAIEAALGVSLRTDSSTREVNALFAKLAAVDGEVGNGDTIPGSAAWSVAAVAWDALAGSADGPLMSVQGFRSTFPLSKVANYLRHCGFARGAVGGLSLYTASAATVAKCDGPLGDRLPPIAAAFAFDFARHILVTASSAPALRAAMMNRDDSSAGNLELKQMLVAIGLDPYVSIDVGDSFCAAPSLFGRNLRPSIIAAARRRDPPGAPYEAFGYGLSFGQAAARGELALGYGNATSAKADLNTRIKLLRSDESFGQGLPYSAFLRLVSARVTGSTIVMDVAPAHGRRLPLSHLWDNNDLAFARC